MNKIIIKDISILDEYYKTIKNLSTEYVQNPSENLKRTLDTTISKYNVLFNKLDHLGYIKNTKFKFIDYDHETSLKVAKNNRFIHLKVLKNIKKKNVSKDTCVTLSVPSILQLKYDGISLIIWKGPFFVTKGNSIEGVLRNDVLEVNTNLKNKVNTFFDNNKNILGIRGEIIMNKEYANKSLQSPVSQVMSIISQKKKTKEVNDLTYIFYEIIYSENPQSFNYENDLKLLEKYNFDIPNTLNITKETIINHKNFDKYADKLDTDDYDFDGLVAVDIENNEKIAIKKNSDDIITRVNNIVFNIKQNNIIPILEIEQISSGGKLFSKVSMSNMNKLIKNKIKIKDIIVCVIVSGGFLQFKEIFDLKTKRNEIAYMKYLCKLVPKEIILEDNIFIVKNIKNDDVVNFIEKLNIIGYGKKTIEKYFITNDIDFENTESALFHIFRTDNKFSNKVRGRMNEFSSLELAIMIIPVAGFTIDRMINKIYNQYLIETNKDSFIVSYNLKDEELLKTEIDKKLFNNIYNIVKYYNIFQKYKNKISS